MFVAMLVAFRRTRGLAREAGVHARCHARCLPAPVHDGIVLAPIRFAWVQRFWQPWFQLEPSDLSMRPDPGAVIAVLVPASDGREMAKRFALANPSIGFSRPVDLIDCGLDRLLAASRADRIQRCRSTARS